MGTHDLRVRLAQIAEREGRPREAANLYAEILRGNPYQVEAWSGLSHTVGKPERALYCLKRVLALDPYYAGATRQLEQLSLEVMSDDVATALDLQAVKAGLDTPIFN